MNAFLRIFLSTLAGFVLTEAGHAHPHVWVTVTTEIMYAPDGSLTSIRNAWAFDSIFSTFAVQGLKAQHVGEYTSQELAGLAETNVLSLKDENYYTFITADGDTQRLLDPEKGKYWLDWKDSILTLHFVLALQSPIKASDVTIDIYDPTIFVDFEFSKEKPVSLVNAPAACKIVLPSAGGSKVNEFVFNDLKRPSAKFATKITIKCS